MGEVPLLGPPHPSLLTLPTKESGLGSGQEGSGRTGWRRVHGPALKLGPSAASPQALLAWLGQLFGLCFSLCVKTLISNTTVIKCQNHTYVANTRTLVMMFY